MEDDIGAIAARAIGGAEVAAVERREPWFVWRVTFTDGRSVVVKTLREHPTGFRTDPGQATVERAALELVVRVAPGLAPRLLGVDGTTLVLEDVAPRVALWDLLADGHPDADRGLRAFAAALGRLHAATASIDRPPMPPVDVRHVISAFDWAFPPDVDVTAAAERDFAVATQVLLEPGPFLALSNGDAGANNFFVDGDDGRIIDWELACFRHALHDVAGLHVPGPMWLTVADPEPLGVVDAYRAAASVGIPAIADDETYWLGVSAACLVLAMHRLGRLASLDGRPPGHESRRQLVATLEAAARVAQRHDVLPGLAAWARDTAAMLRRRWPDADVVLPDAYSTR